MCFYNDDYDLKASVVEKTEKVATKPVKCDECSRMIHVGETVHHIYMQEAEECKACDNGDCDCIEREKECCACEVPDMGETFDYDRCDECDTFLKAVEAAEIEAGCPPYEARPALQIMKEAIRDGGDLEARKYFKTAARMFPALKQSGYLGRLWNDLFVR